MAFALPEPASGVKSAKKNSDLSSHEDESINEESKDSSSDSKEEILRLEREARSVAIEKAYVHDVYEQMSKYISDSGYRPRPKVRQFLEELEEGSLVCDVGCGGGAYLDLNRNIFTIGSDRCQALTALSREKDNEVLHCNNLSIPLRDESLDAIISIAVIHHIATAERRVRAIKELTRTLRVGGRVMISVWAMEQKHRKFESQDVLIPWRKPLSPPLVTGGPISGMSTCTTSEDDVTHYHAYSQTSDSGEWIKRGSKYRRRSRKNGRSIDPTRIGLESSKFLGTQSSSDLSSPNESCYSFVRKAIQKFSTNKRYSQEILDDSSFFRLPWFGGPQEINREESEDSGESISDIPIELRHLEFQADDCYSSVQSKTNPDSQDNCCIRKTEDFSETEELRQISKETEEFEGNYTILKDIKNTLSSSLKSFDMSFKSGSLSSLSSGKSVASSNSVQSDSGIGLTAKSRTSVVVKPQALSRSWESEPHLETPKKSRIFKRRESSVASLPPDVIFPCEPFGKIESKLMKSIKEVNESDLSENTTPVNSPGPQILANKSPNGIKKPILVKQKPSFYFPEEQKLKSNDFSVSNATSKIVLESKNEPTPKQVSFEEIKEEVASLSNLNSIPSLLTLPTKSILKQRSLNEELLPSSRFLANTEVRKKVAKQTSLPDDSRRPRFLKDIASSKGFNFIKKSILQRPEKITEKDSLTDVKIVEKSTKDTNEGVSTTDKNEPKPLKGIIQILSNWTSTSMDESTETSKETSFTLKRGVSIQPIDVRGKDQHLDSATRRSIFQKRKTPSPRSPQPTHVVTESISPTFRRCCLDCSGDSNSERERKLSRGDNTSDSSSKDGSIQSDTSLDSEDSCVSVIFIPPSASLPSDQIKKQRSTSNSSESSESANSGRISPSSPLKIGCVGSPIKNHETGEKVIIVEAPAPPRIVLEKIEEIGTESESENESILSPKTVSGNKILEKKSFEMEDIPTESRTPSNLSPVSSRIKIKKPSKLFKAHFNYPIVRHHPLFAKEPKKGSNFSSLLAGENIRVIRQDITNKIEDFDIFNPETDDLDSDTESSCSSSGDSCSSVVSAKDPSPKPPKVIVTKEESKVAKEEDEESKSSTDSEIVQELSERSEKRRQSLLDLIDENMGVLSSIGVTTPSDSKHRRERSIAKMDINTKLDICFESSEELNTQDIPINNNSHSPHPRLYKKIGLFKTQSLDNETNHKKRLEGYSWITRSVELSDTAWSKETGIVEVCPPVTNRRKIGIVRQASAQSDGSSSIDYRLKVGGSSTTTSGCPSTEGSSTDLSVRKSKTPSPSRPDPPNKPKYLSRSSSISSGDEKKPDSSRLHRVSGSAASTINDEDFNVTESLLDVSNTGIGGLCKLSELDPRYEKVESETPSFPYKRLEKSKCRREDSLDSASTSAKSSVQYSDTSSLLSHRFSTVSISSNLSSDVSFGNTSMISGSSCYLASMSSADFDDKPGLLSSFSFSEAEEHEYLPNIDEESGGCLELPLGDRTRARLPTETSIETSIENPAYHQELSDETFITETDEKKENLETKYDQDSQELPALRAASSQDSVNSDTAIQTQHRFYHVFREGELDHLIRTYVDNLHIINSYYDHSSWCIVAEKVNVWTI